jgi:uncharacterized protein (DUF2235 family)
MDSFFRETEDEAFSIRRVTKGALSQSRRKLAPEAFLKLNEIISRGAYTTRSLAGLIRDCGILLPAHLSLIDRAYLGIPLPAFRMYNQERYKFHDTTLSSTVDFAYHALAVDERRVFFQPTLWHLSKNTKGGTTQQLEQRWFAGVHCNIGGGYVDRGLSDLTLDWMIRRPVDADEHLFRQRCFDPPQGDLW